MCDSSPPPPPNTFEFSEGTDKILDELEHLKKENSYLRSRIRYLESGRSKCKPSKWSKVKGAFGWEKEKDEKETSLTLKVPERVPSDQSSSFSISPAGSYMSHSSLTTPPPPLSSSSSEEDIRLQGRRCTLTGECEIRKNNEDSRRSKSLDGDPVLSIEEQMPKTSSSKTMITKGNKTPWSKVKGIINTKAVRKRSTQEERWLRSSMMNEVVDQKEHSMDEELCGGPISLTAPKLTVTLPSNEELTADLGTKKHGRLDPPNKSDQNMELSPGLSRKSKWFKVRNVFLQGSRSAPSSPVRSASFTYDMDGDDMSSGEILDDKDEVFRDEEHLKYEIEASYLELQNKLEEELSKKYCREVNLSPGFKKKLEEWDKMKLQDGNVTPKEWEHDKERKKRWSKGLEKENDSVEEDKNKKPHSREGSFKKQQTGQGARQEVLIPTSTGTFRFEGISDNFTKKLYEWEQARGIAPEESTFALLGPEYQPSFHHIDESGNGGLSRSKSIGSIADLNTGQSLVQQPSSLSLNDMDDLNHCTAITTGVTRMGQGEVGILEISPREPLFCTSFASEDVARMADSSSSNDERLSFDQLFRSEVVNSSYQLLHDNINLLDKLKNERDVCRQLEDDMRTLEEQINSVSKSFVDDHTTSDQVDESRVYEFEIDSRYGNEHLCLMDSDSHSRHQSPLREYTVKLQDFTKVQTTLFDDEATQTNYDENEGLSYHTHICNDFATPHDDRSQQEVVRRIIGELQDLAERLKLTATEGYTGGFHTKNSPHYKDSGLACNCESYGQQFSTYTLPNYFLRGRRNHQELALELGSFAEFISEKILELKQALNLMTTPSVSTCEEFSSPPPMSRVLHRTMAHDDLSPGENNPGEYRPPSRASSSASSFSYHVSHGSSSSRLHQDWSSPFPFQHHNMSCPCVQPAPNLISEHVFSGSFADVTSDGEISDSGLRINAPNVFVPTTRKIFSPVSESEAVGVIIAEEDEPSETDDRDGEKDEETNEEIEEMESGNSDGEEPEEDTMADRFTASRDSIHRDIAEDGGICVIKEGGRVDEQEIFHGNELIPSVRLRSKSSSPAIERRTPKFSSVCFFFPVSENGVVDLDLNQPEVEELQLGEELTSSLKMRALRIKKAREEFLLGEKQRHGSLSVVVNEGILLQPKPTGLMVKSASEELISESVEVKREEVADNETTTENNVELNIMDLKRMASNDKSALATLAWSSVSLMSGETSTSHSCPTTPVLDKKTESNAASWIKNPARMIFRPKGKYMITDRQ